MILFILVILLTIAAELVATFGATAFNSLLWVAYTRLVPSGYSAKAVRDAALRKEMLQLQAQLRATSSQDEFARWAKLRRTLDRKTAEYEKLHGNLTSSRSGFDSKATALRWALTSGIKLFIQFYYASRPMFWLPQDWVPGYVEWVLSFPRAPCGSVSVQVWSFACAQVASAVLVLLVGVFSVVTEKHVAKVPVEARSQSEEVKRNKPQQ